MLTNGETFSYDKNEIESYVVTRLKYVPVKVKTEDYEAFKAAYTVVENGSTLSGGFSEGNLKNYTDLVAEVTENTNGLKTVTQNEDGSFSFAARVNNGTDSGIKDAALKTAENITTTVKEANGSYGEFFRVDLTGEDYGALGADMQAAEWTYYGSDSTYTDPLQSYGTKFASDNWMHKAQGIQLGLTDSLRCKLPAGTDGTGYWTITVYALGYNDYTVKFKVTDANIVKDEEETVDTTALEAAIKSAENLTESDYTAASPGHSPVERNAPTAEQLLRWSPVPGSVRGEPGTNYRAQKNTLTMIGKGKSISHGVAALEYDLAKEINGQAVATEIARHELYGCTGAEMVQEMKPYHIDFPNVKNNCLRFEVSPSIEESATFTDADWAELGNDFMQRMGLANHQYIIIRHSGTESKKEQAHLHILANRVSLSGELYRDNWIGKKATEAANAIAKERNFVQSQDIGKVNKAEIKEAMDGVLKKMQGFDFTKFKEELGKRGFKVREARASTGKLNGYYVTARSGTEYKASEIGKGYTLAHIERTQSKLKCNSMNISHGNKLTPGSGSFQR